jgi:hypothetical protein
VVAVVAVAIAVAVLVSVVVVVVAVAVAAAVVVLVGLKACQLLWLYGYIFLVLRMNLLMNHMAESVL